MSKSQFTKVIARELKNKNYRYFGVAADGTEAILRKSATRLYENAYHYPHEVASGANGIAAEFTYGKNPGSHCPTPIAIFKVELVADQVETPAETPKSVLNSVEREILDGPILLCSDCNHYQQTNELPQGGSASWLDAIKNGAAELGEIIPTHVYETPEDEALELPCDCCKGYAAPGTRDVYKKKAPVHECPRYRIERTSKDAPGAAPHISIGDREIPQYVAMWKLTAIAKCLRNVDLTYRVIRESDGAPIASLTVADGIQIV